MENNAALAARRLQRLYIKMVYLLMWRMSSFVFPSNWQVGWLLKHPAAAVLIVSATGVRPVGRSDKFFGTAPKTEGVQNYQSHFYFFL